jgi:hypothetical protein
MRKILQITIISIIFIFINFTGCFENNSQNFSSNFNIIEYTISAQKRIKVECCYENITINYGFNYSPDVQYYLVNGSFLSKNNDFINKLKINGIFCDENNFELITISDYVSNISYLSIKKFKIIVDNHYSFKEFDKIKSVKFEFQPL